MASKADFSEAEWQSLETGLTGSATLVALADAHFFDSFKEAGALAKHLADAHQKSASTLIRDLAATRSVGFGIGTSAQQVESLTLEALRAALATLQAKAPDEVSAYSAFVVEVAQSVADAASGVSPAESAALDKVRQALQPPQDSAQAAPSTAP